MSRFWCRSTSCNRQSSMRFSSDVRKESTDPHLVECKQDYRGPLGSAELMKPARCGMPQASWSYSSTAETPSSRSRGRMSRAAAQGTRNWRVGVGPATTVGKPIDVKNWWFLGRLLLLRSISLIFSHAHHLTISRTRSFVYPPHHLRFSAHPTNDTALANPIPSRWNGLCGTSV